MIIKSKTQPTEENKVRNKTDFMQSRARLSGSYSKPIGRDWLEILAKALSRVSDVLESEAGGC